ncbi:unnamed protein product [Choristocarpus tenellus]
MNSKAIVNQSHPVDGFVEMEGIKGKKLAPFNPSSDAVIQISLEMLQVVKSDVVYDLGCGDGRMLVEAVRLSGAQGIGVEYDQKYVDRAEQRVAEAGMSGQVKILHMNVLDADLVDATALFIYLCPSAMKALRETLVSLLQGGARIVTYVFSLPGLVPVMVKEFKSTKIHLYTQGSISPLGDSACIGD